MWNAGSWTVSGSKEAMEFPKNFKYLRKRGVQQRSQRAISCDTFSTDIHFFHTIRHIYGSVWPAREAKPRFGTWSYVLRKIVTLAHSTRTQSLVRS